MQVDFRCFQNGDCYSEELLVFLKRLFQDIDKEKWVWEYCNAPNGSLVILTYCNKKMRGTTRVKVWKVLNDMSKNTYCL